MTVNVELVEQFTKQLLDGLNSLLPQLSKNAQFLSEIQLKNILNGSCTHLLIAYKKEIICGSLTLVTFQIPTGKRAWIEDVVVDKSVRNKGVATKLLNNAKRLASNYGAKTIDLTSRPNRGAANRLYIKEKFLKRNTNVYRFQTNIT